MADPANFFRDYQQMNEALERLKRFDGGGGDGYDGDMEARVAKLEDFVVDARERLTKIETRLDQTATKSDLTSETGGIRTEMHKGFSDMIKWVVGTAIVLGATGITVMTFVLNNATPKAPAAQAAPIIIQVPAQAPPPTSPAK